MDSVSDSLVRNMHMSIPSEVILCDSGIGSPGPPPTKEYTPDLMLDRRPSTALLV